MTFISEPVGEARANRVKADKAESIDISGTQKAAQKTNANLADIGSKAANWTNQSQGRQAPSSKAAQLAGPTTGQAANVNKENLSGGAAQTNTATMQSAQGQAANIGRAQGSQAAITDRSDIQYREGQNRLINSLENAAAGNGPSLANSQLNQGLAAARASQMAGAASQRGFGNTATTMRGISNTANQQQFQAAQLGAQMKVQEQLQARGELANQLSTARAQDIGLAQSQAQLQQQTNLANQQAQNQFALTDVANQQQMNLANLENQQQANLANMQALNQANQYNTGAQNQFALSQAEMNQQANLAQAQYNQQMGLANMDAANQFALNQAQLQQQTNLANQQAQLSQTGLNDQFTAQMLGVEGSLAQQQFANQQAYDTLAVQQNLGVQDLNLQNKAMAEAEKARIRAQTEDSFNPLGKILSDEKAKNKKGLALEKDLDELLEAAKGYEYNYKKGLGENTEDRHFGPMAQNLEKSKIGKSLVSNDEETGLKKVEYGKVIGSLLSINSYFNDKIKELESKINKK